MTDIDMSHDWFPRSLPANVEIGPQSWLYSAFAFIHYRSRRPCGLSVGHDSGLYHGTFFDLGPDGEVHVGNYCTIVGAIFSTNRRVSVGDYSFLAHEVVIADRDAAVPAGDPAPQTEDARVSHARGDGETTIGQNVWIGARAVLCGPVVIGEGAIIGAAAVVHTDVPPYSVFAGNPGRVVSRIPPDRPGASGLLH